MRYLEPIISSGLLKYVRESEHMEAVQSFRTVEKSFVKEEIIYNEGDVIDSICLVLSGSVRSEKNYHDGEVHILSVFEKDSIFALEITTSCRRTTPITYVANEDSTVLFLSMTGTVDNRYGAGIRRAVMEQLADENIRMMHKVEILAEKSLRGRIMVYLEILAQKSETKEFAVLMNREQMARFLCVNRSALSNELNKKKKEGIIDFKRRRFTILDREE